MTVALNQIPRHGLQQGETLKVRYLCKFEMALGYEKAQKVCLIYEKNKCSKMS
jgi:hypothetical protein